MGFKNNYFFLIFIIFLGAVLLFYYFLDPQSYSFLIKCPFKTITGLDCPGCGSQRALHSILHGEFGKAFSYNPLFMIALPYVFAGILFEWFGLKHKYPKIRKILFGSEATYSIGVIVIFYFIGRNI